MQVTFLGTRGNITARTKKHYRHTSTLFSAHRKKLLIDCGKDWLRKITTIKRTIKPNAILISHAHEDHAYGLKNGSPCPVYATQESWEVMKDYAIDKELRKLILPNKRVDVAGFSVQAFRVQHSLNAPAVGFRISDDKATVFYVPDLVKIIHQKKALANIDCYIGDGAIVTRTLLIKKRDDVLIGHAPIARQVAWCRKEKVPRAIFTHCGTEIVTSDPAIINEKIKKLEEHYEIPIQIAYDGLVVRI